MPSQPPFSSVPSTERLTRCVALRRAAVGVFCCLLAATLGVIWTSARPSHAASTIAARAHEQTPPNLPDQLTLEESLLGSNTSPSSNTARAYASVVIELDAQPVAAYYASLMHDEQAHTASIQAATQAHLASVEAAQEVLVASLASYDAQVIYRVQRVMNGVAIYAPADQLEAIRGLPGVRAIYPLIPKEPANARADNLLNAPAIWEGIDRAGLTGEGVTIAIIDTGIDYLHTTFGGPGKGYLNNDPDVLGDAANFPGTKIIGGFDFAGDSYDASPTSLTYQPIPEPDPDPMDCYGFGHGTHVAGTAAGYGVRLNGTTFPGPYDSTIALSTLRIGPGLAPHAQIYALKVFGCSGSSNVVDAAIEWAVDPNGDGDFSDHVDVINLSLGSSLVATWMRQQLPRRMPRNWASLWWRRRVTRATCIMQWAAPA